MADEKILRCDSVTKLYKQGEESIYALHDVSLTVQKGEFLMLCGKSGSGKSTLLNILSGFDTPTSGKVYIDGVDINDADDRIRSKIRNEKIGFVFQSYHLLPILTAKENILTPMLIGKREWSDTHFHTLCETLGITHRLHHLPSEMSGGECQRVAVARAMIGNPAVLFADEPTGNLDKKSAAELMELLKQAHEVFGQTIVMVTHDQSLLTHADRVYQMDAGVLRQV